jgi:hypothetical protein
VFFELGGFRTAIVCFVYLVALASANIALVLYTDLYTYDPESSPSVFQAAILVPAAILAVMSQVFIATVDFALARPLLARKKRKQQESVLPLVASGDPALAERLDEHLDGFGER